MTLPPEPQLDAAEVRLFEKGLEEFNAGYYFECHETLEDLWNGVRGPSRDFFQGLIQLAVALYHLTRGNEVGARSLLGRGLARLSQYPAVYGGIELEPLRTEARALEARMAAGSIGEVDGGMLPKVRRR